MTAAVGLGCRYITPPGVDLYVFLREVWEQDEVRWVYSIY